MPVKKRSILFDMRYLSDLTCGVGQLSLYYGDFFENYHNKWSDLDITLLVPKEYVGKFGNRINYLENKKIYKFFPFLLPKYDIWHSTAQKIKYVGLGSKTVRIMTVHDLNVLYEASADKLKGRKRRLEIKINLHEILTVISKFTENELKSRIKLKNQPIYLNYVGIKDTTKDDYIRPTCVSTDKKFFFTIGQILEKKNFHVLLDMVKLMPEYDLYIVGDDSFEYADMIRNRIINEHITNVFMTGKVSHAEKIWFHKNCEAFLFPSKFEGFGAPVIEAMRFDKPVFSSKCTSLSEIGDKYAFFWENFDPKHMKKVIEDNLDRFYADKDFINAQHEYAFSFSMDRYMDNYLNIYRNIELPKRTNIIKTISNYINYYIS